MNEIWKDIEYYEGLYEISNLGRVKSLARVIMRKDGKILPIKEKILSAGKDKHGYLTVTLCDETSLKSKKVHCLVWDNFGKEKRNGRILQVDHIDNNKLNNRLDNLQLLTNRANCIKSCKTYTTSSQYTGVSWYKTRNKWRAQIRIDYKIKYLGLFVNEYNAYLAYQKALTELKKG